MWLYLCLLLSLSQTLVWMYLYYRLSLLSRQWKSSCRKAWVQVAQLQSQSLEQMEMMSQLEKDLAQEKRKAKKLKMAQVQALEWDLQ